MSFCKLCGNLVFAGSVSCSGCKIELGHHGATAERVRNVFHCSICLDILKEPIKRSPDGTPFCNDCWYVRPRQLGDDKQNAKFVSLSNKQNILSKDLGVNIVKPDNINSNKNYSKVSETTKINNNNTNNNTNNNNTNTNTTNDNVGGGSFSSRPVPNFNNVIDKDLASIGLAPTKLSAVNEITNNNNSTIVTSSSSSNNSNNNIEINDKILSQEQILSNEKKIIDDEPVKTTTIPIAAVPNQCANCGIMDLDMYFIVPDTNQALCDTCFVCDVCKKPLGDDGFVREKSRLLHSECVPRESCGRCGKPIVGKYLCRSGVKIHSECFRCSNCNNELAGAPFYLKNNKELCQACSK